jgi:hypothetical protein
MKFRIGTTLSQGIIASTLLSLLLASSPAFAVSNGPLVLTHTGSAVNAGTQAYSQSGGTLLAGQIGAYTLNPATITQYSYSMKAVVTGVTATGSAQFSLTGSTVDGHSLTAIGNAMIGDTVPAVQLPLGCTTSCTSEVPAFFVAMAQVNVKVDGVAQPSLSTPTPFVFESPYMNPHGGPIVLGTMDMLTSATPAIVLVATYAAGTIQWSGGVTAGTIDGTIATKHDFTGQFSTVSSESEDLVAGTATDSGTVRFFNMNNGPYNAQGSYSGTSSIPSGGIPCGAPFPAGTCTMTGFHSNGAYNLNTDKGRTITGTYDTTWSTPAFIFTSTVTAALSN